MTVLSTAPDSIGAIPATPSGMVIAGATRDRPFLVEGGRSLVIGNQQGSLRSVAIDCTVVVRDLETDLGSAVNLVLYPGLARREIVGPRGCAFETVLSPETLPFVAVQWSASGGTLPGVVRFVLPTVPDDSEPDHVARGIWVRGEDGRAVAAFMTPTPTDITLADDGRGNLTVTIRPSSSGPSTLIIAAGSPDEVRAALAATSHLSGHTYRAAAGPLEGGLDLHTGVAELDEGFAWARIRTRHSLERLVAGGPTTRSAPAPSESDRSTLMLGLAALIAGDAASALCVLSAGTLASLPIGAVLAARYAASTGQSAHALDHAQALLGAGLLPPESSDPALDSFVRSMLADSLRHGAPESMISELRRRSRAADEAKVQGEESRSLPMVGSPRVEDPWARWVDRLLRGDPTGPIPSVATPEAAAVRESAALFSSDPDAAWASWRHSLSGGLADGPAGPGSWDPVEVSGNTEATTAAELILALGHGLLGIAQDAPVGRIRIAPRFPSHLTNFGVGGISLGTSSLRLDYRRSGLNHAFTLTPQIAAVPPLVVFEPMVPGRISEVRVDGVPASLELRSGSTGTIAPIQLPIDGERTVEITTA